MSRRPFYDEVMNLLKDGDRTVLQIANELNADAANVYKAIKTAREEHMTHVASWKRQHNSGVLKRSFTTVRVYRYGPGKDAPKPKPIKMIYKRGKSPVIDVGRASEIELQHHVLTATREVLARDPGNVFASMLGQMGAV